MSEDGNDHTGRNGNNGFTTKEMLVRLETIVDRIEQKLDAKTDKRDFDAFEVRVVAMEAATNLRLVSLETASASAGDLAKFKRWLFGTALVAAAAVLSSAIELYAIFKK